jgi:hypothetical protein
VAIQTALNSYLGWEKAGCEQKNRKTRIKYFMRV